MRRNLLGFRIFLEWTVPLDWFLEFNTGDKFRWKNASKTIGLLFLCCVILGYLEKSSSMNMIVILLLSLSLAFVLYFFEYFVTKVANKINAPDVTVFKKEFRVKYNTGYKSILIKDIISYKFERIQINSNEFSVLVLKINDNSEFKIALPQLEFEKSVQDIFKHTFHIPQTTSND